MSGWNLSLEGAVAQWGELCCMVSVGGAVVQKYSAEFHGECRRHSDGELC